MTETAPLMEEDEQRRQQLLSLAEKLFLQLVKLFLRHNIQLKELEHALRWAGIQIAAKDPEFAIEDRDEGYKQSYSSMAVTTGLTRQEISARINDKHAQVTAPDQSTNRLIRILTGWRTDEGYQDENGNPRDIPVRGGPPSFHQLCIRYGHDTPTRPIADALVKNGNVEWIGDRTNHSRDKVLRFKTAVVTAPLFSMADIEMLKQISSDFVYTLQEACNDTVSPQPKLLEAYFNDIAESKELEALDYVKSEMTAFNSKIIEGLKRFRAKNEEPVVRLGVGSYSIRRAPLTLNNEEGTNNSTDEE